jgi:lipoprotein-anchoring transpeptidase ErfK/SrfK
VAATATGESGKRSTVRSSFTTMKKPAADKLVAVTTYLADNGAFGVALPIAITFGQDIPKKLRASVQRRMFVDSTPRVVGAWHWWSGREVHFRPREHWPLGTRFHVRLALGGLPLGGGAYGASDVDLSGSIVTHKLAISIDDKTKHMTVTRDGRVLRRIPVSLGAPASPTSSGKLVVMTRNQAEIFDSSTFGRPVNAPGGYREVVYWDLRFTWGGEYIHAAPWSVGSQGFQDVSNGCVNASTENAQWLFGLAHVGDPVTVRNTGSPVSSGDGWTDWNMSWNDYLKGSAIPLNPATGQPRKG